MLAYGGVDFFDFIGFSECDFDDCLCLSFCFEDEALFFSFGFFNFCSAFSICFGFYSGGEIDCGFFVSFGDDDVVHGLLDVIGWFDSLEFNSDDIDAPGIGLFVEFSFELLVEFIAFAVGFGEGHFANNISKCSASKAGDLSLVVVGIVDGFFGVDYAEIDDGVDKCVEVVLGDDFLWFDIDHVFGDVYADEFIDSRYDPVEALFGGCFVFSETFDKSFVDGSYDAYADKKDD